LVKTKTISLKFPPSPQLPISLSVFLENETTLPNEGGSLSIKLGGRECGETRFIILLMFEFCAVALCILGARIAAKGSRQYCSVSTKNVIVREI
jgi:hypothetical protein